MQRENESRYRENHFNTYPKTIGRFVVSHGFPWLSDRCLGCRAAGRRCEKEALGYFSTDVIQSSLQVVNEFMQSTFDDFFGRSESEL